MIQPLRDRTDHSIRIALENLYDQIHYSFHQKIKSVRGDAEKGFLSRNVNAWAASKGITTFWSGEKFTNKNRIVDSAIKTIRDAIGYRRNVTDAQLIQIVQYYNHTKHSGTGFTPQEMMEDPEKEGYYIRQQDEKLAEIRERLPIYKVGTVVLVHLDMGKTDQKFEKKRRTFDRIGVILGYEDGNYTVQITPRTNVRGPWQNTWQVVVPEYCVRYVCDGLLVGNASLQAESFYQIALNFALAEQNSPERHS